MLSKRKKSTIITKFKRHKTDTGSEEVQAGLLTERIKQLSTHLKKHPKDLSSKRSLIMLVAKRRRLLNYLKKTNLAIYNKIIKKIKI